MSVVSISIVCWISNKSHVHKKINCFCGGNYAIKKFMAKTEHATHVGTFMTRFSVSLKAEKSIISFSK